MQTNDSKVLIPHNIIMNDRSKLNISGVIEVESYDEQEIIIHTVLGTLTVSGSDLKIERLSVDEGDISINGNVDSLIYSGNQRKGSFLSKLFG